MLHIQPNLLIKMFPQFNTGVIQLTTTADYSTTIDVNNLKEVQIYNQTTLLSDKVQLIVQKVYQPL